MMSSFTYNKAIGGSLHKYGARILLAFGTRMGTTAQTVSYIKSLSLNVQWLNHGFPHQWYI